MAKVNPNPDFFGFAELLSESERAELAEIREYLEREIKPIANEAWANAEFPAEAIEKFAKLGVAGVQYPDYGDGKPRSALFTGFLSVELNRVDPSLAVFSGVHSGLAMGSIHGGGDQEQRDRWMPDMVAMNKIGAFALTEPEGGSDVAGGMRTTARREGDEWVLDGAKRWIGNGTFADLVVVWARDEADGNVKGFVVEKGTPGFTATKIEGKIALRTVQNADIVLDGVRVPEANRLQGINSFRDTARVLAKTRGGVAWQAVGVAMRAYELAREYAVERVQFGKPIASFQMIQDLLVKMLGNVTAMFGVVVRLAQLTEQGTAGADQAALAKAFTTTRMREVVSWARELFGGNGIVLDHEIAKFFSDAEAVYSFEGSREMNTLIVGKSITGISAFA
ncbi:glutaryl-CoA dehydrogenase [Saccharopolyspora erythraea NRRL 2338]|uniref:Glutaryl-CoA dehydrogenase n=2 Tax=Saccharopolyspora erythraea TaxID=1836 RepID=A4FKS1_SACEN|nr:acyl-CoA dehydrogenase family protein [Saccharopolyspora erythraea]EQD83708.1 acyl-CoA dehydrogenase [Saccharopolyspora erythraea D]PFG98285.1 glutaryl-CoA dehydrogenase [Saccharopolyspora erythraea NRRL 2338]QRK88372.1 acyl-CoA dehydrogenase family protein [Saccharopolyspora erythraea]CAM04646.1 putative glutaryl-CoA dehydrogenase [Saccharopolyspora erythraea NRRL 2338]